MFTDEIKALLLANTGIAAAVTGGIYDTVLPRGFALPAMVIHVVTTATDYTLAGTTKQADETLQFDVYGDSAATTKLTMKLLKILLRDYKGVLNGGSQVQGAFWVMDMDMPYSTELNKTATGFRAMAHVRFVYIEPNS